MIGRRIAIASMVVVVAICLFPLKGFEPWTLPHWPQPLLGADEYGRDLIVGICRATINSLLRGAAISLIAFVTSFIIASLTFISIRENIGEAIIGAFSSMIDSVPQYLWVMAIVVVFAGSVQYSALIMAFTLSSLPLTSYVIFAEFSRLARTDYVSAARALGATELRILFKHIIPNSLPVIGPITIQLLGAAIGVDGALAWLGFSQRSSLTLGAFLLRGKEWALSNPLILATTILAFLWVFFCLTIMLMYFQRKSHINSYFYGKK